uniref:Uncharacterized protein n=1 Tax=Rhodosorus marinus TaxID=101924 RepID=A0A7S3EB80_9RHOD|mmetsp:Transcript_22517/g.90283  ORF Transcript_22517/g.90283 Transcript_22517/m.90283 type:complete len:136 (+) Transcript_22517:198-605(+)
MEREEGWKEAMSVEKRKREEREGSLARAGPVQRRRRFDYELVETVVPLPEWDERTFRMRVEAEIQKYAAPQSRIRKSTAARTNMNGEVLQMYSCSVKRCSMRMRSVRVRPHSVCWKRNSYRPHPFLLTRSLRMLL